jgi:signal peptidase II
MHFMLFSLWRRRPRILWMAAICVLVAFDQITKAYFANTIALGGGVQVTDWFNLVHLINKGAAFSMFADASGWQRPFLIGVSLLVILPVTVVCMTRQVDPVERGVGGLVVAGGMGNLIDRIQTGGVVDFLDLHWRSLHWPAFNLADIYVVSALLLWIALSLKGTAFTSPSELKAKVKS